MNRYLALAVLLWGAAPAVAAPMGFARSYKGPIVQFKTPPLSGFFKEVEARRGLTVLKTLPPGLETSVALYYHKPPEVERRTGNYFMTPSQYEHRPGYDLSRDVALLKKALASLPKQIESVWPTWRESVVDKVGISMRPNDYEEWKGPKVYVDLISREPVSENHYQVVRLEKKGRRWALAEPPKELSAVSLYTAPLVVPESGGYSMDLAQHALRDSDVVADVKRLSRSLKRLLRVPRRYSSYILDALSLGVRTNGEVENGRPALKASLTSNKPVRSNLYESVTLVTP